MYNYKIIDFLSTKNVIEVKDEEEFNLFYKLLERLQLTDILTFSTYDDWKIHASINNKDWHQFYFEYDNSRGLSWYDNKRQPLEWYGVEPINVKELYDKGWKRYD